MTVLALPKEARLLRGDSALGFANIISTSSSHKVLTLYNSIKSPGHEGKDDKSKGSKGFYNFLLTTR